MENQHFRKKLIEVRKAQGLTQEEVANRCKITVRTIQRIESGKVIPRAYTIKTIADHLGISFYETSTGDTGMEEQQANRKNQSFYWYPKDLFNLRTNPMQKISIFTAPFILIGIVLFFVLHKESNAQTMDKGSSLNAYSFDVFHETKLENENLFLSPISTYYALLMAYEGAKKKTKQEFEEVLYLNKSGNLLKDYLYGISSKSDSCSDLKISNAIWLDNGFVVEGEYSKSVSDQYLSDFEQTDFANIEETKLAINAWVSAKTNHTINELVQDDDLSVDTKFMITNAVYFKGEWLMKFNKQKTISAPFFTSEASQYTVDLMEMTESLRYYENNEFQFIAKPYRNLDLSFGIILPKKLFGISAIEKKLNNAFYQEILDSAHYTKTAISIPKLKLETCYDLRDALISAGLKAAFTNEADFSGITKDAPIELSKVLHKTWIELDEEKTEAAATTAITVRITGTSSTKIFKADHPFVFFIFDNEFKAILFIGRYVRPENGQEIEKENLTHNLERRKIEKISYRNVKNLLFVIDNKPVSPEEFNAIDREDIESMNVSTDKEEIAKYSSGDYDGALILTLKEKP